MSNSLPNTNKALYQELQDTLSFLDLSRNEFNKHSLLYNALEECCEDGNGEMHSEFQRKIADILLNESCINMLPINKFEGSGLATNVLLGLVDCPSSVDYEEAKILRESVEHHIAKQLETMDALVSSLKNIEKTFVNNDSLKLNKADEMLIELYGKTNTKQETCAHVLAKIKDTLEMFCNYKINNVPDKLKQKLEEFKISTEVNHLRSQILHDKTNIQVLTETKNSLNAYKELLKDIKKQQEQLELENNQLKDQRENYKLVASKQYDGILKSYLQYKKNIEKKKMIFNMCKMGTK